MITLSVIILSGFLRNLTEKFEKVTQTKDYFDENNKTFVETVPSENSDFILSMTVSNKVVMTI